jgi:hypothetical protein
LVPSAEECPAETGNEVEEKNHDVVVYSYQGLSRDEQAETQPWNADEALSAGTPILNYGPAEASNPYIQPMYVRPQYN